MFSGVYGKIDHILNGTDHRALKKAHGIGSSYPHEIGGSGQHGILAARHRGIVADHGRICPQFPIRLVDHHLTFSRISNDRLLNIQELAFSCLSLIQE
jgi:hypothetical protein